MSFHPFILTAGIQGETMVGFLYASTFQLGWDWRLYHSHLREFDVNYSYTEHHLPPDEEGIWPKEIARVKYSMDGPFWTLLEMPALRYWLQYSVHSIAFSYC